MCSCQAGQDRDATSSKRRRTGCKAGNGRSANRGRQGSPRSSESLSRLRPKARSEQRNQKMPADGASATRHESTFEPWTHDIVEAAPSIGPTHGRGGSKRMSDYQLGAAIC